MILTYGAKPDKVCQSKSLFVNALFMWGSEIMINISDETLSRTTKCPSNFHCLNDGQHAKCSDATPLCRVDYFIGNTDLVVSPGHEDCPYKVSFGMRYVCSCPVRQEIYQRYHI
jgi:hypothetical protein